MAKLYLPKKIETKMLPKKETINFLLNYSRALQIIKTKNHTFEYILN